MAEKKISDLTPKTGVNNDDEFVFVDKATTSGTDASTSGQTSKITFGDLKTAVGTQGQKGETGLKGAPGADSTVKGDKGAPGEKGAASTVKGDKGAPGQKGAPGAKGAPSTVKGDKGAPGAKGAPSTVKGDKGAPGEKGASGSPWSGGTFTGNISAPNYSVTGTTGYTCRVSMNNEPTGLTWKWLDNSSIAEGIRLKNGSNADTRYIMFSATGMGTSPSEAFRIHGKTNETTFATKVTFTEEPTITTNVDGGSDIHLKNSFKPNSSQTSNARYRAYAFDPSGSEHVGTFQVQPNFPSVGMTHTNALGKSNSVHVMMVGENQASFHPLGHGGSRTTLGSSTYKWQGLYTNTDSIGFSDINGKTEIRDLNEIEKKIAQKLKSMIKIYKFKDAVSLKGDKARLHTGFIAQQVEEAFASEGLNGFDYGLVGKDTWYEATEEDGEGIIHKSTEPKEGYIEKTEYNVRISELLAFVISAL